MTDCWHGDRCYNKYCKFLHGNRKTCKFGNNCNDQKCTFNHSGGEKKETTNKPEEQTNAEKRQPTDGFEGSQKKEEQYSPNTISNGSKKQRIKSLTVDEIHFTQDSIKEKFRNNQDVQDVINKIKSGEIDINEIPKIKVVKKHGKWYSLDNRRLFILKEVKKWKRCKKIEVERVFLKEEKRNEKTYREEFDKKNSTMNEGKEIRLRDNKPANHVRIGKNNGLYIYDETNSRVYLSELSEERLKKVIFTETTRNIFEQQQQKKKVKEVKENPVSECNTKKEKHDDTLKGIQGGRGTPTLDMKLSCESSSHKSNSKIRKGTQKENLEMPARREGSKVEERKVRKEDPFFGKFYKGGQFTPGGRRAPKGGIAVNEMREALREESAEEKERKHEEYLKRQALREERAAEKERRHKEYLERQALREERAAEKERRHKEYLERQALREERAAEKQRKHEEYLERQALREERAAEKERRHEEYLERKAREQSYKLYKGGQFTPGGGRAPKGGITYPSYFSTPTSSSTGIDKFYKGGQFTPGGGRAPKGGIAYPSYFSTPTSSSTGSAKFYKGGQFTPGGGRAPKGGITVNA